MVVDLYPDILLHYIFPLLQSGNGIKTAARINWNWRRTMRRYLQAHPKLILEYGLIRIEDVYRDPRRFFEEHLKKRILEHREYLFLELHCASSLDMRIKEIRSTLGFKPIFRYSKSMNPAVTYIPPPHSLFRFYYDIDLYKEIFNVAHVGYMYEVPFTGGIPSIYRYRPGIQIFWSGFGFEERTNIWDYLKIIEVFIVSYLHRNLQSHSRYSNITIQDKYLSGEMAPKPIKH